MGYVASDPEAAARRDLLQRLAGTQRSSALLLRTHGREQAARRAERAALRIGLVLEEPGSAERMLSWARGVRQARDPDERLEWALEGAMELLGARFGNIQLHDASTDTFQIVVHDGFGEDFLEHFAAVDDESSVCGRAAGSRAQVVVVDVDSDAAVAPQRRIAAAAGFRAVQSTPLIDREGRLRGILSTHFREPHRPSARELLLIGWYADEIAGAVAPGA